jgi:hypothetical protein
MTKYDLIKQAIQNRQCVTCNYKGHIRKLTPHVIGTKGSVPQALFYQYAGGSSSGLNEEDPTKNWRCMPIAEITDLTINNDSFQTADNHSVKQTCVDNIDLEVRY